MKKLSKRERTRITVMHAAKGLFEKHGLDNVTFHDIAEASGVCRTTVFNHFSDTNELMIALTEQEVCETLSYVSESDFRGIEIAGKTFEKLIEDASLYPVLTGKLISNAILTGGDDNPVRKIEELVLTGLKETYPEEEAKKLFLLISGAYYGLINHYHVNNKSFDAEEMKKEFRDLLSLIIK